MNKLKEWWQSAILRLREWQAASTRSSRVPRYLRVMSRVGGKLGERTLTLFRKRPSTFYVKLFSLSIVAFFLADIASVLIESYLPEPPKDLVSTKTFAPSKRRLTMTDLEVIATRNLFNSKGLIPDDEAGNPTGAPVKTTLPFDLLGTIILQNEILSLATIEDKTATMVYPVRIGDEIPGKARITKIEARRVVFINLHNNRNEFVDLPEDENAPIITGGIPRATGNLSVQTQGENKFSIARTELEKTMANINQVLSQALARPVFEDGQPAGYRLTQIAKGSIYEQLGLKENDILKGFDGNPVTDPITAWEKLSDLKNVNHLELNLKRNGVDVNLSYDIY